MDELIEAYILNPSPLTELVFALDDINGWDTRDVKLGLYIRNIVNADDEDRRQQAIHEFGTYVWAVLYDKVKYEVEVNECDEDVSYCQSMGVREWLFL